MYCVLRMPCQVIHVLRIPYREVDPGLMGLSSGTGEAPRRQAQSGSGNDIYRQSVSSKQEGDMTEEEMTILTAREAAEYLRVSPYTLRRMESEGSLIPFRTPGGHRRYSLKMLNEYLEKSRKPSRRRWSELERESGVQ